MSGKIVILTGAGISAESGLATFRDTGGLWDEYDLADVATPEGFARNPALVHEFYNARRARVRAAEPNAAHMALARLERDWPGEVVLVTQNIDDLHEKGGHSQVIHMHGEASGALCSACDLRWSAPVAMYPEDKCPSCGARATRPDIVWFGEMPYYMDEIGAHLRTADLFAAIGTSGQVYPAAGFVMEANAAEATTVEINLEASELSGAFDRHLHGPASEIVPKWVDTLLGG